MPTWGAPAGALAAALVAGKRRKIVAAFRDAGALAADSARTPEELGLKTRLVFRRLARNGVLVDAGGGRYYLDEEAEARARATRLSRVALILAGLAVALAALFLLERPI